MERRPYRFGHAGRVTQLVATGRDPPVVSGRWRVLGAALRRAITSRKAVPADVKEQFCVPLHSSFQRERGKVYPILPLHASGILEVEVSRAVWDVNARLCQDAAWKAAFPVSPPPALA